MADNPFNVTVQMLHGRWHASCLLGDLTLPSETEANAAADLIRKAYAKGMADVRTPIAQAMGIEPSNAYTEQDTERYASAKAQG